MTMTKSEARQLAIDVRTISDEQISALRKLAVGPILSEAGRLATWLHAWTDTEQAARAANSSERTLAHLLFLPPLDEYSDRELADAADALTQLAFANIEESLTFPVDRLMVAAVGMVTDRLRQK